MEPFDPNLATIGGVSLPLIHMTLMSQLRAFFPRKIRRLTLTTKVFDLINYPVAAVELLLLVPPWPLYSGQAWATYLGAVLATATAISATAKKVQDAKANMDVEDDDKNPTQNRVNVPQLIEKKG